MDDLRQRTVTAPLVLSANFVQNTVLSARELSDNDALLDIGYHYDILDYCWSALVIPNNVTVTLNNGVAVGFYGTKGLVFQTGGKLLSEGLPGKLNRILLYNSVQEQPPKWGNTPIGFFDATSASANVQARFTQFIALGSPYVLIINPASSAYSPFSISHSYLQGIRVYSPNSSQAPSSTFSFINNIFERCSTTWYDNDPSLIRFNLNLYNNLYQKGDFTSWPASSSSWFVYDNFFNVDSLTAGTYSIPYSGNNAYKGALSTVGGINNRTGLSAQFEQGPLGPFYYASTWGQLNQP